jgi:iron-sulfur cluster repair protein YtfE (RIC family)
MNLDRLRADLMAEHEQLRERLGRMEKLAQAIESGQEVARADRDLRNHMQTLRTELVRHLEREDAVLGPIICNIDAWGKERAQVMEREHAGQHKLLITALDEGQRLVDPLTLAGVTHQLARDLLCHMEEEEQYLLHPEVLTDDLVKSLQYTD